MELSTLRKQVQALQIELARVKGEDVSTIMSSLKLPDTELLGQSQQVPKLVEKIKQLEFENRCLDTALKKAQLKSSEFMTRCIKMEAEREMQLLRAATSSSSAADMPFDAKLQEQFEQYVMTIQQLNDRVKDTEEQLSKAKEAQTEAFMLVTRKKMSYKSEPTEELKEDADTTESTEVTDVELDDELDEEDVADVVADMEFDIARSKMSAELDSLEKDIQLKEGLVQNLYKNQEQFEMIKQQYDTKLKKMESEVKKLKDERDRILRDMEQQVEVTEEQKYSIKKLYEDKVNKLTEQVVLLKTQQREQERLLKLKAKSEEKINSLQGDIIKMKKQKVELMKKMKDEAKNYAEWKKAKEQELLKLKREAGKQERTISALQAKTQQQDLLLHRRLEELQATQRKLKEQLPNAVSSPPTTNTSLLDTSTTPASSSRPPTATVPRTPRNPVMSSLDMSAQTRPRSSSLTTPRRPASATASPVASPMISANLPPPPKKLSLNSSDLSAMLKNELAKALYRIETRENLEQEIKKRNVLVEEIDALQLKLSSPDFLKDTNETELAQVVSQVETLEINLNYQKDKISFTMELDR